MAFGFPPKYQNEFSTRDLSIPKAFSITLEVFRILDWDIVSGPGSKVEAHTKFSLGSWSEVVTAEIKDSKILITSKCNGSQILDWGKNKANFTSFRSTFERLYNKYEEEGWEDFSPIDEIEYPQIEQPNEEFNAKGKEKNSGILALFKPTEGYFYTPILINLNIILFVIMTLTGVSVFMPDSESLLMWGANFRPLTLNGEWWRLITSCFLHIGIFHLLFNMYALLYVGIQLEPILGKHRFISAYLLSGIIASVASLYWNEFTISAGASGAIFGMYGVFLALLTTNLIGQSTRKPLLISIAVFVGYNLLNGTNEGVDNAAHIGGLIGGLLIGYAFYPSIRIPQRTQTSNATIAVLTISTLILTIFVLINTEVSDRGRYEEAMEEFASNEEEALGVFELPEGSTDQKYLDEIRQNGLPNWKENLMILKGFKKLDLPENLRSRNEKLLRYCRIRIEVYELIYSSIKEGTNEYQPRIQDCNREIQQIFKELDVEN